MKTQFNQFPVLTTARLTLRKLLLSDLSELMALRSDREVNKYLNRGLTCTRADAEAFVRKIDKTTESAQGFYWAIALNSSPGLIGTICYWNIDPDLAMAEIGYELAPAYQGEGFMSEAIEEVMAFGLLQIGLKTILALTHPDNEASINLLKKVGFHLDESHAFVCEADAEGQKVFVFRKS